MQSFFKFNFVLAILFYCAVSASSAISLTTVVSGSMQCSFHSEAHRFGVVRTVQYCSVIPYPTHNIGVVYTYNYNYPTYYYDHVHHYPICNTPGCSVYCPHSIYTCPYLNAVFPVVPELIWARIALQYRMACRQQYRICAWNTPIFLHSSCHYQYYDCLGYYP